MHRCKIGESIRWNKQKKIGTINPWTPARNIKSNWYGKDEQNYDTADYKNKCFKKYMFKQKKKTIILAIVAVILNGFSDFS